MAQTQFLDSLFPGNPVFIAVTLNLNYLLFRYFQYAFHLDDSFQFGAKILKRFRLCYTCWAGRFPLINGWDISMFYPFETTTASNDGDFYWTSNRFFG